MTQKLVPLSPNPIINSMAASLMSYLARQRQFDLRDKQNELHSRAILYHIAAAVTAAPSKDDENARA
jgi:hypothetical protein